MEPFLWIIAAGSPATILQNLELKQADGWPTGVYFFGANMLRVGLVVASELPRGRSTLLVRLMAAGRLLARATADLASLPPRSDEQLVAEPILRKLSEVLEKKRRLSTVEKEFVMAMQSTWEQAREIGRKEGRAEGDRVIQSTWEQAREIGRSEGRNEGRAEGERALLARQLQRKFGRVSPGAAERIEQATIEQLETWGERVLTASTEAEVLNGA